METTRIRAGLGRGALRSLEHPFARASRRWRELDRPAKVALGGLALLLAGGVALRAWLFVGYRDAFLGFPDAGVYVKQAASWHWRGTQFPLFGLQKPAGYPLLLRVLHFFTHELSLPILLQHGLGLATGLVLYKALRRTGAPPYLGLLPAAIVFFGGTGVLVEHSLLSESSFAFVQALGVYAAVRALGETRMRWPLLAGVAIGASFWLRTVGLSSVLVVAPLLLLAAPGALRRRLLSASGALVATLIVVLVYVAAQGISTGYWGYERAGGLNLYGRVATFVDCASFTPPAHTRFLCPVEPVAHRQSANYFEYARSSPVAQLGDRYGAHASSVLQRFSVAAIEHEPISYAGAILRGLAFYVSPRACCEGYAPQPFREELLRPVRPDPAITSYYPHARAYSKRSGSIRALSLYETHTRIEGPILILLLAAALAGAALLRGRTRWAAILLSLTAIVSATLAVAGNSYDVRYAYPAFGPLGAGAALGAWAIALQLRQLAQRRLKRGISWRGREARQG
jgi:hypothetical protein